jgi:hypothetical protein
MQDVHTGHKADKGVVRKYSNNIIVFVLAITHINLIKHLLHVHVPISYFKLSTSYIASIVVNEGLLTVLPLTLNS